MTMKGCSADSSVGLCDIVQSYQFHPSQCQLYVRSKSCSVLLPCQVTDDEGPKEEKDDFQRIITVVVAVTVEHFRRLLSFCPLVNPPSQD